MDRALKSCSAPVAPNVRKLGGLSKEQREERMAAIKSSNRTFNDVASAVRREFAGMENWKQVSESKSAVASRIISAIQDLDSASDDLLNKATRTVIQEIYAIEEWPTTKRVVTSRATAAIRRLKLGS